MRKVLFTLLGLLWLPAIHSQSIQGAWTTSQSDDNGLEIAHVLIFAGDYFSEGIFEKASGKFKGTKGGGFTSNGDALDFHYEYSTTDPESIGRTDAVTFKINGEQLELGKWTWKRLDDGTPGDLHGAWLISGRKRDGKIVKRDTSGPRKTMKILSGTRFQWIAYNTETKQFMGTGGGTYTTVDGKYTENIGFFSRDDSRVGASLQFDYELKDGDWHHSGLSSKGDPIYEVWSQRNP